jgi:transposase
MNLDLDDFDEEYVDAASSAVCPNCGHKVYFDNLVVINDVFYASDVGETDEPVSGV